MAFMGKLSCIKVSGTNMLLLLPGISAGTVSKQPNPDLHTHLP